MIRVIAVLTALLLALSFLAVQSGTDPEAKGEGTGGAGKKSAVSIMKDVTVTSTEDGNPRWSLRSGWAELSGAGDSVKTGALELTLQADGVWLTADSGLYDVARDELELRGDVRAELGGYTLNSGSLIISPGQGRLKSEGSVVLKGNGITIMGAGMSARDGGSVRLLDGVKAVFD